MEIASETPSVLLRTIHRLRTMSRAALALGVATVAAAAILTSLWSLTWTPATYLAQIINLGSLGWGREGAYFTGALLLLLVPAVARGKRHAWGLLLVLLGISLLGAGIHLGRHSSSWLALGLVLAVLASAPLFSARSDPRALRRGYIALCLSIACLVVLRIVLEIWHPGDITGVRTIPGIIMLVGPRHEMLRRILLLALRILLVICLGYGIIEVLRPVLTAGRQRANERQRAARIVRQYARTTTAHYALGTDKTYYWSASGRALVAYRLMGRVALMLGDPIGPAEEHAPLLRAFLSFAQHQDWSVASYLATPDHMRRWRGWGLPAIKIGEEALIDVAGFSTEGKAGAPVRHSVTRARRDGMAVRCWQDEPVPAEIFTGLQRVSAAWLSERGTGQQMGFSMGRFPADWTPDLLTAVALDAQGEVRAFLTWTPLYAGNGWALDIMRRSPAVAPGTMELLIVESVAWARAHGYACMTLGLAPLAGLDDHSELRAAAGDISWLERSAGYLHRRRLLLGDYVSLYRFKAKFQPRWEPRYLLLGDRRALPHTVAALMRALGYSGVGMLRDVVADILPQPRPHPDGPVSLAQADTPADPRADARIPERDPIAV